VSTTRRQILPPMPACLRAECQAEDVLNLPEPVVARRLGQDQRGERARG